MIRQFDVVRNPLAAARTDRPFLVCIQHHHLYHLATRLMAPLATERVVREQSRLNPALVVAGRTFFLLPQDLQALPIRLLGSAVTSIESERGRIVAALDLVFTGI